MAKTKSNINVLTKEGNSASVAVDTSLGKTLRIKWPTVHILKSIKFSNEFEKQSILSKKMRILHSLLEKGYTSTFNEASKDDKRYIIKFENKMEKIEEEFKKVSAEFHSIKPTF